jgi:propionate CoA-transferase
MPKIVSAADAVKAIPDGATVAVNSSSGLNCPDAVLKALGEKFARDGAPRNLTMIHPIAAGDMFGIRGVEHIAQKGSRGRYVVDDEYLRFFTIGAYHKPSPGV